MQNSEGKLRTSNPKLFFFSGLFCALCFVLLFPPLPVWHAKCWLFTFNRGVNSFYSVLIKRRTVFCRGVGLEPLFTYFPRSFSATHCARRCTSTCKTCICVWVSCFQLFLFYLKWRFFVSLSSFFMFDPSSFSFSCCCEAALFVFLFFFLLIYRCADTHIRRSSRGVLAMLCVEACVRVCFTVVLTRSQGLG